MSDREPYQKNTNYYNGAMLAHTLGGPNALIEYVNDLSMQAISYDVKADRARKEGKYEDYENYKYQAEHLRTVVAKVKKEYNFTTVIMCDSCDMYPADLPSNICVGCHAYKDHQQ